MVSLRDEGAPELTNVDTLMQKLWYRFEDPTETCWAEAKICSIRQGKQPVTENIQEFRSLVAHLRDWPEPLLVYQSQDRLNREL